MIFMHVDTLPPLITTEDFFEYLGLVADGSAHLLPPVGESEFGTAMPETEEILLQFVAVNTIGGFKVYYGTNIQTPNYIVAWGMRLRNEQFARRYFPMLKDIPWCKD